MKPKPRFRKPVVAVVAALSFCAVVQAQTTFTKANNNTSLNDPSSYTQNSSVPTASDTIQVNGTLTGSSVAPLGGDLSIFALSSTADATPRFMIGETSGATLTIGAGGITVSGTGGDVVIGSALALSADQTWSLSRSAGPGQGTLLLNTTSFNTNGHRLAISGNKFLDIRTLGSLTLGSTVMIDTSVSINGSAATTDVTFAGNNTNNTLNIVAGKLRGNTIGNHGSPSAFGDGGVNTAIVLGSSAVGQNGTMIYTGNTVTSNRTVNRDARSVASGIEVSTAGQTLTLSGNLGSGTQINALGNGWVMSGAGNLTLGGVISNSSSASMSNNGTTVTKTGNGTLTLNGNNTFSGGTQVNAGTLMVNNSAGFGTGTGNLVVAMGASLGGNGTIGGETTIDGNLNPGNSPGLLTFSSSLALNATSLTTMEINGTERGITHDSINVVTSLVYGGNMTLAFGTTFGTGTYSFNLFDQSTGHSGSFDGVNLSGNYSGTLVNNGSGTWELTSGNEAWSFSQSTGDLGLTVVPEPSSWALLAFGLTTVLANRRRRNS